MNCSLLPDVYMQMFQKFSKYILRKRKKKTIVLQNVFKTSYRRTALLSYVKEVFENDYDLIDESHTNKKKTFCISKILSDLGYNIDVIDWQSDFNGDCNKYQLVLGLGKPLEDILRNRSDGKTPYVILFAAGCNTTFSNKITLERVVDFYYRRKRVLMSSSRFGESFPLQQEIADWIILHGDKFAKSTYRRFNIDSVLAPVFIHHSISRSDEDWIKCKSNYLWFGSTGVLHKGLDLLVETFKNLPQYTLHICGNLEKEREFYSFYKQELDSCANIIFHGFINVDSQRYKQILRECAFVIFPSVSEGNCAAVITCMANGGLIPVVTRNADIDLEQYGVEIMGFTENDILSAIERSQQLSLDELKSQTAKILHTTKNYHSFEHFREDFKNKLIKALKSPNFFEKMDAMDRTKNH